MRDDAVLWTLTKHGRSAQAIIVPVGGGAELRYLLDGDWYYTHFYPDGHGAQLLADAGERRKELEAKGWREHEV